MIFVIASNNLEKENDVCNVVETCTNEGTHCYQGAFRQVPQHPSLSQICAGMARLCE